MMCKLGVSGSFAVLRDTERLHWGYQQRTGDQCVVGVPLAMAPERGELMGYYVQRRENSNVVYTITDKPLTAEEWSGSQLQQQRRNSLSSVGGRITKPSHGNQALRYHLGLINPFGIDRATLLPHRALPDAIVTAAIFLRTGEAREMAPARAVELRASAHGLPSLRHAPWQAVRCGAGRLPALDRSR